MTEVKPGLLSAMRRGAAGATGTLRTLANEDRLLLLCALCEGERCVSELEARVKVRQPTLSQQLGVLRRCGFVRTRRSGKQIFYSVADPKAHRLLQTLQSLYCP
jgi:ArsR family transcriptional regulator